MKETKEKAEIIIDAAGAPLGRLASFASKQALRGKRVVIVNAERALISGRQAVVLEDFLSKLRLGRGAQKGPLISRQPAAICRRAIRGMIGWKSSRGRKAFKLLKCYEGIPAAYQKVEKLQLPLKPIKGISLARLSALVRQRK